MASPEEAAVATDDPVRAASDSVAQHIVVVIPTLNEAANLPELAERLRLAVPCVDVLIVDDRSTDGTPEVAERAFAEGPRVSVLVRVGPRGLGRAYVTGFQVAIEQGYEVIVQMDADLSHDPAAIPSLLAALKDADLVIGSRYCKGGGVEGWAPYRLWLSRWANLYARTITGSGIADITAGFRAWRASALASLDLDTARSSGYSIQVELAVRARARGLRIREVPIVFTERRHGKSKMNLRVLLESVWMPWSLRGYLHRLQREEAWRQSS